MSGSPSTMPFAAYLAIDALNWSSLRWLHSGSPLHYQEALRRRAAGEERDSAAMAQGRAVHAVVLEPDEFPRRYVVMPDEPDRSLNRSTREGKERWAEWLAAHPGDADLAPDAYRRKVFASENPGREMISREEYDTCLAIRDAVRAHGPAQPYLVGGECERVIEWSQLSDVSDVPIRCKARIDIVHASLGAILDLKRVRSIDKREFAAQAERLGWFLQLAFYRRGIRAMTGADAQAIFLAVEAAAPHDVAVFRVAQSALDFADEQIDILIARLAHHRRADHWPGRYPAVEEIDRPLWVYPRDGEDFEILDEEN